jgi:hypothetical protein
MTNDTARQAEDLLAESRAIWDTNADAWDAKIAGGGGLQTRLVAPVVEQMLNVRSGDSCE